VHQNNSKYIEKKLKKIKFFKKHGLVMVFKTPSATNFNAWWTQCNSILIEGPN
jgi:hypothetical protein